MGFFLKGGTLGPYGLEGVRQLGSLEPRALYPFIGVLLPWLAWGAAATCALGFVLGFLAIAEDARRGDLYAIVLIHVPAAWMSVAVFGVLALCSGAALLLRARLFAMMAQALAPTGALFALLTLWTGSLWGKPTWGTWWVWDARLTSELILLFLYIGFLSLTAAIEDERRADRAGAVLALVGVINIPIIYFSVKWWNTLHQGASVSLTKAPTMATTMLTGMLLMALAAWFYTIAASLHRARSIMLEREQGAEWTLKHTGGAS